MPQAQRNRRIVALKTTNTINAIEVTLIPNYVRTHTLCWSKGTDRWTDYSDTAGFT